MDLGLRGKVAVVTGASRGIGRAIANALLNEGCAVAICGRNAERLNAAVADLSNNGARVIGVPTDVTSEAAVGKFVGAAVEAFGRIDILVNNAGISGPNVATWDYPIGSWHEVMRVNLDSAFYCCRAIVPLMIAQNYGRIVNVASIAGKEGNPMAAAYSASKAAVIALTKAVGKDFARTGVSVNCVAPAVIETAMLGDMSQEHVDYMVEKIPMGRMGSADEVAALICWLASEECSFSTGATYDISGGRATY